jgi:hypothetical protein
MRLVILGHSGRWRRFLPGAPAPSPGLRAVAADLGARGWRVRSVRGFMGPAGVLLGATARLPGLLRRDDLTDRLHAAARERFIVTGRRAAWAALWLIVAEREGTAQ